MCYYSEGIDRGPREMKWCDILRCIERKSLVYNRISGSASR